MQGLIIGIVSLKGGAGRTTSSMYLAAATHKHGHKVTVIDSDNEGSALNWYKASAGNLPFEVVASEGLDDLETQAESYKAQSHIVIIDSAPNNREQLFTIAMCCDVALVPTSATGTDINRLKPTLSILSKVEKTQGAITSILLTRYDRRRVLTKEFLELFADYPILDTKVSNKAIYQSEFGAMPTYTREYSEVLHEVLEDD